jgi:hypothetical protein
MTKQEEPREEAIMTRTQAHEHAIELGSRLFDEGRGRTYPLARKVTTGRFEDIDQGFESPEDQPDASLTGDFDV